MDFGTGIVIVAGTMTFTNEWYQTGKVNWRVPIATVLLAGAIGFLGRIDNRIGNGLGVMIFIGAGTTKFNGHSAFGTLAQLFGGANPPKQKGKL
jgi:hypothetical protein